VKKAVADQENINQWRDKWCDLKKAVAEQRNTNQWRNK